MNKSKLIIRLMVGLLILASAASPAFAQAAAAEAHASGACDKVDFLITNGMRDQVFVDITNWSTMTRVILILEPGQSQDFSMDPGWFEFWANNYVRPSWDLSGGGEYAGCTRVGVKIRPVNRVPQFKVVVNF